MSFERTLVDVLMEDGTEYLNVPISNKDRLRGEDVGARHKWGSPEDKPMKYLTFYTYASLIRTGKLPAGTSYDQFVQLHEDIAVAGQEQVDPTETVTPGV
ncbi:MAG: hypothetical protein AMXMBFR58_37540 [Phycisphaerae bacterium]